MEEQIKCIKSSQLPDETQDSFTEGKIYVPFSYNKVVGYGVFDELNQSHWIYIQKIYEYFRMISDAWIMARRLSTAP